MKRPAVRVLSPSFDTLSYSCPAPDSIRPLSGPRKRHAPGATLDAVSPASVKPGAMPPIDWQADPLLGAVIDERYRVLQCIGQGGMGRVYLAEHLLLQRRVAIKILHASLTFDVELAARFRREARAAAAIRSEHVVQALDMGQLADGAYYLVMEHLEGSDLAETVNERSGLPLSDALHVALQLCDALIAVHACGIVHRDLKPENLFLARRSGTPAVLKLLDFGVCRARDTLVGGQPLTQAGALLGTPHYMAPEQIDGSAGVDPRTDLHALGAVLYFMLIGRPPFEATNLPRLLMRICSEPAPCLRASRTDLPAALAALLQRLLEKRPEHRYTSALTLRRALQQLHTDAESVER